MSGPKLTPWYPATVKPVRVGWYEYTGWGLSVRFFDRRYWTGKGWRFSWERRSYSGLQGDEWRGLAAPPKDAP
jgi:hypothetical protein